MRRLACDLRHGVHSLLSVKGVSTDRTPGPALLDPKNLAKSCASSAPKRSL